MLVSDVEKVSVLNPSHKKQFARFVAIDFETTGLSGARNEVIEFAAVRIFVDPDTLEGEIGLNIASLCKPQKYIPAGITEITGITGGMVRGCPGFEELLPGLMSFLGDDVIVAHNAPFDLSFLLSYCERAGIPFGNPALCTLSAARKLCPKLPSYSLAGVAGHLGVAGGQWHRALGDAMATAEIFTKLWKMPLTIKT
jgi:DNA polymerase-3 subunit alpha (Gram-positive type)